MSAASLSALLALAGARGASAVECTAFVVSGDPTAAGGATWTYAAIDKGQPYALEGILFAPPGTGPFPAVVVSHGKGGSPYQYAASVARVMVRWGMVVIGTMYTHAPDALDAGNLPDGPDGASEANVLRAHKTRELLACVPEVDTHNVAAHGHSLGAFVTGQVLGTYRKDFKAASHTAGGVSEGPNATRPETAALIVTPYQLHHSASDTTVSVQQDVTLAGMLANGSVPHALYVAEYPGYTHAQIALDPAMLERVRGWYEAYGVLP
jgi:dienelactone hydrolase